MVLLIYILCCIAFMLCLLIPIIISWGIISLLCWLISLCLGLHYSLLVGTGVWLIYLLVHYICE